MIVVRLLLLVALVSGDRDVISAFDYSHVVVLPDVHGDVDALLRSLWLAWTKVESSVIEYESFSAALMDAADEVEFPLSPLSGRSDVALIQLGDLIDRGPHSFDCLRVLEVAERVIGWHTIRLLGNHEILALLGKGSEFAHPVDDLRDIEVYPASGYARRMVSDFNTIAVLDGAPHARTLFVHGGFDIEWLALRMAHIDLGDAAMVNSVIRSMMQSKSIRRQRIPNENASPFWTRWMAQAPDAIVCDMLIDSVLEMFEVARIIIGHTPQTDRQAKTRCGGKIILADVKMSHWMSNQGARPVALVMRTDRATGSLDSITAHYTDLATGVTDESVELLVGSGTSAPPAKEPVSTGKGMRRLPPLELIPGLPPVAESPEMATPETPIGSAAAFTREGPAPLPPLADPPRMRRLTGKTRLGDGEPDSLYELVIRLGSRPRTVPDLGSLIYSDPSVAVFTGSGEVVQVVGRPALSRQTIASLAGITSIPEVAGSGRIDASLVAGWHGRAGVLQFIRMKSRCTRVLTHVSAAVKEEILKVLDALHSADLVLGLTGLEQLRSAFLACDETQKVHLVNWSAVRPAVGDDESIQEWKHVKNTL